MKKHTLSHSSKVKHSLYNAPYLLPLYFKAPYNPDITRHICEKHLSRSCGIEIECFGSIYQFFISNMYSEDTDEIWNGNGWKDISDYYGVMNFREDNYNYSDWNTSTRHDCEEHNEHKIRISDYKQLPGLYEILKDMKETCRLNEGSGIHIHVDIKDLISLFKGTKLSSRWKLNNSHKFESFLNKHLKHEEIDRIFYGENGCYTGEYNQITDIRFNKLHQRIAIRNEYNTLEFRTAPMSFEYTDIAKWCIKLSMYIDSIKLKALKEMPKIFPKNVKQTTIEEVIEDGEVEEDDTMEYIEVDSSRRLRRIVIRHV